MLFIIGEQQPQQGSNILDGWKSAMYTKADGTDAICFVYYYDVVSEI